MFSSVKKQSEPGETTEETVFWRRSGSRRIDTVMIHIDLMVYEL
jgi:hypothetical protein